MSTINNSVLLNDLLEKRTAFAQAKQEYINAIKDFLGNAIDYVHISFKRNRLYVSFESFATFDDKYLLSFCDEFGFLAPMVKIEHLQGSISLYKWEFIKLMD